MADSPASPLAWEPVLAQKLCLMSIRRWVDEAVAMHRRENGIATPTGLAGQIAAQVWLHVSDVLAHETPALCHCGCSRPAHTFWREGGIFTACKICACEGYEPLPPAPKAQS